MRQARKGGRQRKEYRGLKPCFIGTHHITNINRIKVNIKVDVDKQCRGGKISWIKDDVEYPGRHSRVWRGNQGRLHKW